MHADHLRLLSFGKDFSWEKVPAEFVLLIQCIMGVRQRFDYIVRCLDFEDGVLFFQIRDARNSIIPGTAEAFIDEINYLTAGRFQWMILNKLEQHETIGVLLPESTEMSSS